MFPIVFIMWINFLKFDCFNVIIIIQKKAPTPKVDAPSLDEFVLTDTAYPVDQTG